MQLEFRYCIVLPQTKNRSHADVRESHSSFLLSLLACRLKVAVLQPTEEACDNLHVLVNGSDELLWEEYTYFNTQKAFNNDGNVDGVIRPSLSSSSSLPLPSTAMPSSDDFDSAAGDGGPHCSHSHSHSHSLPHADFVESKPQLEPVFFFRMGSRGLGAGAKVGSKGRPVPRASGVQGSKVPERHIMLIPRF